MEWSGIEIKMNLFFAHLYVVILVSMTSCLDTSVCPSDQRIYSVPCPFALGMNLYVCKDSTTCINSDRRHHCCAYHIAECVVLESSLHLPTLQPTMAILANSCHSQTCPSKYNTKQCYWYESHNINLLCNEDNHEYCCTQNRSDCCQTSQPAVIIVFSCIGCVIILFLCLTGSSSKILPVETKKVVETSDNKYQITITI